MLMGMTREEMLRCVVPLLGLALLSFFAELYVVDPKAYYRALATIGISPFRYPFLDWEGVVASIKCSSEGINVYITNPCDVLNRPHDYSPLWLRAVFIPTDGVWTMPFGIGIILAFLLSLFWLVKPADWRELIFFALACTSPMVVFALERGNVDVILFVMLVAAGVLSTGRLASRILSYALMLLAGLLKFYPLIVLLTTLRERPRTFFAIAAVAGLLVIGFFYRFRTEIAAAMKIIPSGGNARDLFGSVNLPFGMPKYALRLFPGLEGFAWFTALPYAIMTVLLIVTAVQMIRFTRNSSMAAAFAKMPERDAVFLVIGAALIAGCFFAGQNISYRGVHLIFVTTGLVALRRAAGTRAARATLTRALMMMVFLMWEGLFRQALSVDYHEVAGPGPLLFALFWCIREVLWWRLVALLLAMLVIFGIRSEPFTVLRTQSHLRRQKRATMVGQVVSQRDRCELLP